MFALSTILGIVGGLWFISWCIVMLIVYVSKFYKGE